MPPGAAESAAAQLRLGRALRDAGRLDEASAQIEKLVAVGDRFVDWEAAIDLAAQVHERAGRSAQARRTLEAAVRAHPDSEALALSLGGLLDREGESAHAIDVVRPVLNRSPDNPAALNFIGYVEARTGAHLAEAQKLLERALAIQPASGEIADSLGWLCVQQGRLDEAQRLLERAERLAPDDPEVQAHLGDLYLKREDRARALTAFHRALTHRPNEKLRHAMEERLLLIESGRLGVR